MIPREFVHCVFAPRRIRNCMIGVRAEPHAPETRELLDKAGAEVLTSTPAELSAMIRDGVAKYAKIVKTAGVAAQ